MSSKTLLIALGAMSIVIPRFYSEPPPAVGTLKGTVRDATRKAPIGGVKVQVMGAGGAVLHTLRTNADGTYQVSGLPLGQNLSASYSAAGYAPDPWTRPLTISKPEVIQDVSLLCDCKDAAYWRAWVDTQKASISMGAKGKSPSDNARHLNESWSALGYIGLSAEARGLAATSLVNVEPVTRSYSAIGGFAAADPMLLRKTEEQVRTALQGGRVQDLSLLPMEVTAEIAAVEVRKQSKADDKEFKMNLEKLDVAAGTRTKDYTREIIGHDAAMKRIADRYVIGSA